MRSAVAVPILFAAASAAPALALPVASSSTGSEAINWHHVGNDIKQFGQGFVSREEPAGSEAINWHHVGNDIKQFGQGFVSRDDSAGSQAVNWKTVGTIAGDAGRAALHFLRQENPPLTRAFEHELLARADAGSEAVNWHNVGHDAEQFTEGVFGRAAPEGSEAVDWKTVGTIAGDAGRVALHFLREDGSQAINWHNVGHDVEQFGEGVIGREEPAGSQAVNWKTVGTIAGDAGRVALHFLREEDPILARRFNLKPISRIPVTHFRGGPSRLARDEELLARADGSEAINWHNVGHNVEQFGEGVIGREDSPALASRSPLGLKFPVSGFRRPRDDQLLARALADEMMARELTLNQLN